MRLRRDLLLILIFATLIYRLLAIHQTFLSSHVLESAGFTIQSSGGRINVTNVVREDADGNATSAYLGGLQKNDVILEVTAEGGDGHAIKNVCDLGEAFAPIEEGRPWTALIARSGPGGDQRIVALRMPPIHVRALTMGEWVRTLALAGWVPLLALITGAFIGLLRPRDPHAFVASLMLLAFSSMFYEKVHLFPVGLRSAAMFLHATAFTFAPYLIFRFFLRFPRPSLLARQFPSIDPALLILSVLLWVYHLSEKFNGFTSIYWLNVLPDFLSDTGVSPVFSHLRNVLTILALGLALLSVVLNTIQAEHKHEKRRMALLLTGVFVGLTPLITVWLALLLGIRFPIWMLTLTVLALGIFPLSFAYVVLRHRVFGIQFILRKGLQYALVSRGFLLVEGVVIFTVFYFFAAPLLAKVLPRGAEQLASMTSAALAVGIVAAIGHVNRQVMPLIDKRFFRDAYNAQQILSELSHAAGSLAMRPEQLVEMVARRIGDAMHPDHVVIYLRKNLPHDGALSIRCDPVFWTSRRNGESYEFTAQMAIPLNGRGDADADENLRLELPESVVLDEVMDRAQQGETQAIDIRARTSFHDDPPSSQAEEDGTFEATPWKRRVVRTKLLIPLGTKEQLFGFLSLGEKRSEEPYTREDKNLLQSVGEQLSIALGYSELMEEIAEKKRMQHEIEIAEQVQAHLFPQTNPVLETIDYDGQCRAARGVGGDYYDFLPIGRGRLALALGDITGKGISAALLMSNLQAMIRSQAQIRSDDLLGLAEDINRMMCEATDDAKYATIFYALYDDATRRLTYVNAGHNAPILVAGDEKRETLRLTRGGMAVGMFPEECYEVGEVALEPNDMLVIFSDGITEAMNDSGNMFGEDRLVSLVEENRSLSHDAMMELILDELANFSGDAPQHDDETLVVAKIR